MDTTALSPDEQKIKQALSDAALAWDGGDYEDALGRYRELALNHARIPAVHDGLIKALFASGLYDEARQAVDQALHLNPTPPGAVLMAALDRCDVDSEFCARALRALVSHFPDWELARIALWQCVREPMPGEVSTFPNSELEHAHEDSTRWLEAHGEQPWVGFPCQVLDRAIEQVRGTGLLIECGVYFGRSLRYLSERLPIPAHGFDSFEGLPESWLDHPAGAYSTSGRMPRVADHVTLHQGWFEDTLPPFAKEHVGQRIALLHIDCDLYSSTLTVLDHLGPLIDDDTVVVFDDLCGLPGWREHEYRALQEFVQRDCRSIRIIAAARVGREVAMRLPRS